MARSILMNFSLKPNIDSRVFTESALAQHVSCGFTSCPVQFEGVFITDWIGLLSIALNKVSAVIYRLLQPSTACYIFHTITYEAALKNGEKKSPLQMLHVFCLFISIRTSRVTHIFANKVLLILYDAPRSDADSADLAP